MSEERFMTVAEVCRTGDRQLIRRMSIALVRALFGDLLGTPDPQNVLKEQEEQDDE